MNGSVTSQQLEEMAVAACDAYEFNCDWSQCAEAAKEYALEEFGIKTRNSACFAAVNLAHAIWQSRVMEAAQ